MTEAVLDMESLDRRLTLIEQSYSHLVTKAEFNERMDALEGRMDTLEAKVGKIITILERIERRLAVLEERVAAIEGKS